MIKHQEILLPAQVIEISKEIKVLSKNRKELVSQITKNTKENGKIDLTGICVKDFEPKEINTYYKEELEDE